MRPLLLKLETKLEQVEKILNYEKPVAERINSDQVNMLYQANTSLGMVYFRIPLKEASGINFQNYEPATLLKRWIAL